MGGGGHGWSVFDGPARSRVGGGGSGGTPGRGGPKPVITGVAEAALRRMLAGTNHRTLAECRDLLAAEAGVEVHPWTVGRALRRMGWT